MDTVKKGDKLETQIYELFKSEIHMGNFLAKKEYCKIFTKKGYYSKDREKDIIFDVSIEIYLPGQKDFSILFIIECKNYNHPVPVDDAEEFFAKIQQISGANVKGVIASTNSFQNGTFKFSKSKGIGLLRYFTKENRDWILNRSPSSLSPKNFSTIERSELTQGLNNELHRSKYLDLYGFYDDEYTNSLQGFFSLVCIHEIPRSDIHNFQIIFNNKKEISSVIPFISEEDIEKLCISITKSISYSGGAVSLEEISDNLNNENKLKVLLNIKLDKGVLGNIHFGKKTVSIDNQQCDSLERSRFTLAHELGHYFLNHSNFIDGESCYESDLELENPPQVSLKEIVKMEWQANTFSSFLLMPKKEFIKDFLIESKKLGIINKGHGYLYLDNQQCNQNSYYTISAKLMRKYKVSRAAVRIRLMKLGLISEPPNNEYFRDIYNKITRIN